MAGKHSVWHVQISQEWCRNESGEEETDGCGRQAIIKSKCNRCWQSSDPGSEMTSGSPPTVTKRGGRSLTARGHQGKLTPCQERKNKRLIHNRHHYPWSLLHIQQAASYLSQNVATSWGKYESVELINNGGGGFLRKPMSPCYSLEA